ncbi:MAG: hypothetical protein C0599_12445 [Salinivirgaceae bacterium]|nr:MAG: hypothetical protein C0599_12445 [Salinivirgaceae bacterium]
MKQQLKSFSEFAHALYPHEISYLLKDNKLQGKDSLRILQLIHYNSQNPTNRLPFDPKIDKRKYSNIKKWIQEKLAKLDVDIFLATIKDLEQKIMTDAISAEEEKQLITYLNNITPSDYYFLQFYELVQHFRDFLLIRIRMLYYESVSEYLDKYKEHYIKVMNINYELNNASFDIIKQQSSSDKESEQWIQFLTDTFHDKNLDGYTRYRAVVRLLYVYYNYRRFDEMKEITDILDRTLHSPIFYSKRILANFYANRSMMYQKRNELEEAVDYGYLSIRQQNSDYLFYINNLCGILLKQKKYKEAIKLMQNTIPEMKQTNSFYNRIGFVSLYLRTLLVNGKVEQAASYGETFSNTYRKEIFAHRWHGFYTAFLQVLLEQRSYKKLLSIIKRNDLVKKEREFLGQAKYLPTIQWYYWLAAYLEAEKSEKETAQQLQKSITELRKNQHKENKINQLIEEVKPHIPDVIRLLNQKK